MAAVVARREGTSSLELVLAFEAKRGAAGILIIVVRAVFVTFPVVFIMKTIFVVSRRQFGSVVAGTSCILRNLSSIPETTNSFFCELGCIFSFQVHHIHFHGCLPDSHSSHGHSDLRQLPRSQAPRGSWQPPLRQTPSQKVNPPPRATFPPFSGHPEPLSNPVHLLNHGSRRRMRCSMMTVRKPRGRRCEFYFCMHLRPTSTIRSFY